MELGEVRYNARVGAAVLGALPVAGVSKLHTTAGVVLPVVSRVPQDGHRERVGEVGVRSVDD